MDDNESFISAPPPPPEVKVRTMRSDLAAMAKSGGGVPRFESVKVAGWAPGGSASSGRGDDGPAGKRNVTVFLVVGGAIVAAAIIGYFVYVIFLSGNGAGGSPSNPPANTAPPAAQAGTPAGGSPGSGGTGTAPTAAAPAASAPFTHTSLFTKPVDQTLTLALSSGGAATTAADLQSFGQKLGTLLSQAKASASFIEVDMVDAKGNGVAVSDVLADENATVLDPQFLAAHFKPDATFFVYRDAAGTFWPGYVIALQPSENWLYLQSDVAKLESSPAIASFFLTNVGAPAAGGFTDATVSSTPVRILSYPNANPPASFLYGWRNGDLILSTSQKGFEQALAHL